MSHPSAPEAVEAATYLAAQPPERHEPDALGRIRSLIDLSGRRLAVLDDDPTGTQCVHDVPVLTTWEEEDLRWALGQAGSTFFVLTNSRSLPPEEAGELNHLIGARLRTAAAVVGVSVAVASRSDSTLRGHFPLETDVLAEELGPMDGVVVCPCMLEAGRLTIDDVHWVRQGDRLVPAGATEFARDESFGYRSSRLPDWVEEKTGGRWPASEVVRIGLADLREGGPDRVAELLEPVRGGRPVTVNAASYADLEVFTLGLLAAEAAGRSFVYRIGPSFVRVRGGISESKPLRADALYERRAARGHGMVFAGSHVAATTRQLEAAWALPGVARVELSVAQVLDPERRDEHVIAVAEEAERALEHSEVVVYTSREEVRGGTGFDIKGAVSAALVEVVRRLPAEAPLAFIIAKGGITSSDIGTRGLDVRRAEVAGQLFPGQTSVWILPEDSAYPGLPYVVFPGNVGGPDTLAEAIEIMRAGTASPP